MNSTPLYHPLEHQEAIRLIRFKPGSNRHDINVTLEPFILCSDVKFNALSYVWGSPTPQRHIFCNGHEISITPNLHAVLRQLIKRGFDGLLWVDALCINQHDNEEKNTQVAMMRDIFSRATKVFFWLGEQEPFDEDGARLMEHFSRTHRDSLTKLQGKTLDELSLPVSGRGWIGWSSLLQRPWFGRVWIVQEFFHAKDSVFMSGTTEIPREVLMHCAFATGMCGSIQAAVVMNNIHDSSALDLLKRPLALVIREIAVRSAGKEDVRILDLWSQSCLLEATDQRDRVFALLSLQTRFPMDMIDYRKSLDEVYTEVAQKALTIPVLSTVYGPDFSIRTSQDPFLTQPQRVSRFLACKQGSLNESSLPSWVPDWRPSGTSFVPLTRHFTGTALFEHPYQHAVFEKRTMSISGIIVDKLWIVVDSMPYTSSALLENPESPQVQKGKIKALLNWQCMCFWLAQSVNAGASRHELLAAYCRTMAFGALPELGAAPDAEYIGGFLALTKRLSQAINECDRFAVIFRNSKNSYRRRVEYDSRFSELSQGRKFCVTRKKRLAWIPQHAESGDEICFLVGCGVPFVIRRAGESWRLLGDCYVSDLMCDGSRTFIRQPEVFKFE